MSVMLFIIVVVASFIIVRIGAIAFQLTGLEWSLAKFQSLSCFSGTGFTTREAELVTGHPQRRRIATILIVLGNAGFITMIASIASAMNAQYTLWAKLSESFLPIEKIPPSLIRYINLLVIILSVFIPHFSYSIHQIIPLEFIVTTRVYFLNTLLSFVFITHLFPNSQRE